MDKKLCFAFCRTKYNRNSIEILKGAVESRAAAFASACIVEDGADAAGQLRQLMVKYPKTACGLSFTSARKEESFALIGAIKKSLPGMIVVAGGPHASGDPGGVLEAGADIVVIGEGEETLCELLAALADGGEYAKVKGLAYLARQGGIVYTGKRKPLELDSWPAFSGGNDTFGYIEITRGCPWRCRFCQASYLFGSQVRHRSCRVICEQVKKLMGADLTDLRFITPNSLAYGSGDGKIINLKAVENLLASVKKSAGPKGRIFFGSFPSEIRPDFVSADSVGVLKEYADNDNLIIGAQSGSARILKEIGRGHGVKDIYRSVELLRKAGFKAYVDVIFGFPRETEADMLETLVMMKDLVQMGARIHGHAFTPLAGTPYYKSQPAPVSKAILAEIGRLAAGGKLYGAWNADLKRKCPK